VSDNKPLTPIQRLTEATARIAELEAQAAASTQLAAQVEALTKERDAAAARLADASAKLAESTKSLETAAARIAELEGAKRDIDDEVARLGATKAQEFLAKTGVSAIAEANPGAVGQTTEELWSAYNKISDIYERTKFYRAHEKQMSKAPVFIQIKR
jgi:predicted  nucleic acid-binding Zn-ribbon protein